MREQCSSQVEPHVGRPRGEGARGSRACGVRSGQDAGGTCSRRPGGWGGTSVSVPGVAWSLGRVLGCQEGQDHICMLKITKVTNIAKFYCGPGLVLNALL